MGPRLVGEFFAEEGFVEALPFDENSFGVPARVGAGATKGVVDEVDDCGVFGFDCGIEVHIEVELGLSWIVLGGIHA